MSSNNGNWHGLSNGERKDHVDRVLKQVLHNVYNPNNGYVNKDITKIIWPDWQSMDPETFYREASYIQRRMGGIRHEAYRQMWEQVKDKENPISELANVEPDFLPFALPLKRFYWTYFNAVKKPYISNVIKLMFKRSEGMDFIARLLEGVYNNNNNANAATPAAGNIP